jgi:hypothetical protein
MSINTRENPDQLPADEETPEAGWRAEVVQAYLKLVNRIAPYRDQGTPQVPQLPESDGGAT